MKSYVEFKSVAFPPYETESDETNPGIYGKRLAEFLQEKLEEFGLRTNEMFCEDWGVVLPIESSEVDLWIGMANYEEYENGFLCFIEPSKPVSRVFPWFWKVRDNAGIVSPVAFAINKALESNNDVSEIKWSSSEEFNST